MSRQPPRPTKAQTTNSLRVELDKLVQIDEQRNQHQAALTGLQSARDIQLGRMQAIAEHAGIDLEQFATAELAKRRGDPPPT